MILVSLLTLLFGGHVARAQEAGASITPSFGDGKLKILGEGFKPNENVTITVKVNAGTFTLNATANAQGQFELDTGLSLAPGSSVELDARGDQGSGSASITSVPPALPLPQTGATMSSFGTAFLVGLVLLIGGFFLATRRLAR
ncbi:MAG TPA: hypothetical protein VFD70_09655 [Anaerolineae bacterium]|nr:hypothetical protein [Anaerolineae bacterium]